MIGLQPDASNFFVFAGMVILVGSIGCSLGVAAGAAVPNIQFAMTLMPMIIMPLVIFSGFLVRPDNIPIYFKWIYYIDLMQYAFQVFAVNEFKSLEFDYCKNTTICPIGPGFQDGTRFLQDYLSYNIDDLPQNVAYVAAFLIAFWLLGLVVMYIQARRRRN